LDSSMEDYEDSEKESSMNVEGEEDEEEDENMV
jgi:hypothetical protein